MTAAAAEEAVDEQDILPTISPSSPTTTTTTSTNKKKLVWMALAVAVVVVAVIVIPVTITQQRNNNSSSPSSEDDRGAVATNNLADPNNDERNGGGDDVPLSQSPTLSPSSTAQQDDSFPMTMSPTTTSSSLDNMTLAPSAVPTTTTSFPNVTVTPSNEIEPTTTTTSAPWTPLTEPILGDAAGTPYLHCPANPNLPSNQIQHIVLLHGAAFSKEVWVRTGILQQFCNEPTVSVTALDMSFATFMQLQTVLEAVTTVTTTATAATAVEVELPVVLVTPSAGGSAVVDWMINNGDIDLLQEYMNVWIPVAVGSLSSATDAQVQSIAPIPVLAIYGDEDVSGGRISQRLARLVGATVVELVGGHPAYLQSPNEFVATILEYLSRMTS